MKKAIIRMSSILIALLGIGIAVHDAFAVDPPHNGQNTVGTPMTCNTCHYDTTGPTPSWATQPTTTDETFFNNMCTSCHQPGSVSESRYVVKTHSSSNVSGKYGAWTIECRVCHNPHYQDQVSSYPTDLTANLFTGTVAAGNPVWQPSYTESTINVTATGLTPNEWIDFMLVPNVNYPTRMYRIKSNTATSFTVMGAINGRYAATGSTFAVRLGSLVKGQVRMPSGATTTVKFFTAQSNTLNSFASSTDPSNVTGICQVCHTQTHSFNRQGGTGPGANPALQESPLHPSVIATGQDCTGCHIHVQGFKGECTDCHGYPPHSPGTLIFRDRTGASVTSDSGSGPGAHVVHVESVKLVCSNCHNDGMLSGASAGDNYINIKFNTPLTGTTGSYDGKPGRTKYPYTGATTGGTYQCSNIYCHSSGQGTTSNSATPVYATPQWNNPASGRCGTCHGITNATLTSGNHSQHLSYSPTFVGCGDCHTGAANDASSYVSANHLDRTIDVANGYTAGGAAGNGYGTCSAAACHGSGTPVWGMNVTGLDMCTVCHGTPTAGAKGTSGANMAPPFDTAQTTSSAKVGAHQAHLRTNSIASPVPCQECHIVPTNVNDPGHIKDSTPGVSEVTFTNAVTANGNGAVPSYSGGTCLTTYCHGAAMPKGTTSGADTSPSWNDSGYITGLNLHDCAQCHGFPPTAISAHLTPTGLPLAPTTCTSCHNNTNASATGFVNVALHINKILEVSGCNGCHGQSGSTGAPLIPSDLVSPATGHGVGMHPKHVATLNYTCYTCHDGNTMPSLDSTLTMSFRPVGLPAGGAYAGTALNAPYQYSSNVTVTNGAQQTCSNLYCHGAWSVSSGGTDTTPVWTNSATGACGTCHGATTVNPPTLGSHAVHASSFSSAGYQLACTLCHANYAAQHVDGQSQVAFTSGDGRVSGGTYTGTSVMLDAYGGCSNIYCHSQGTRTTTPYVAPNVAPMWGATLDCTGCHSGSPTSARLLTSNAHSAHINDSTKNKIGRSLGCTECHNATVSADTVLSNYANHANQLVNIKFNGAGINKNTDGPTYEGAPTTGADGAAVAAGGGNNACSNVYCHSSGNLSGTNGSLVYSAGMTSFKTPTWSGTGLNCDACHGDQNGKAYPVYATGGSGTENSHVAHVATNGYTCNFCHMATTISTTITAATMTVIPGGAHLNRTEDVAFATYWSKTGSYNPATKTCSATYCHGQGAPQWGNAAAVTCGSCHFGSSDNNDFTYNNGNLAVISQAEWTTSGHGRSSVSGSYPATNNGPADLASRAGSGDACLYCHNGGTGHGDSQNYFRLRSFTSGSVLGMNQVCLNCHKTGSNGVNPFSGTSQTVNGVSKVDKWHYGSQHSSGLNGGRFCWDCHEPHGDRGIGALGPIAMVQSRPAMSSDAVTGKPMTTVSTTVTFTSRDAGSSYGTATAPYDRICNVCHTYNPTNPNKMVHYTTSTSDGHNAGTVCTSCHKHSSDTSVDGEAFKGGACNSCHGYPPMGGDGKEYMKVSGVSVTVFEGKGGWASGPSFSGGHKAHVDHLSSLYSLTLDPLSDTFQSSKLAILCGSCHDMSPDNHSTDGNGTRNFTLSGSTYTFGTLPPTYNGTPGVASGVKPKTCSNVSCHYQDAPTWQAPWVTN